LKGKIEGRIEVRERRGKDVSSYWMMLRKEENIGNWKWKLDRTVWRIGFGRGYGPVVRLARERMKMGLHVSKSPP
jgi:hypothetical protein